ncbi:MAG: regulatory signaling modulator protein AmpE [Gammaproteobacteria bacterium]|nr:regulatory signaling modulator protein AmpE [Gammaproteobacteria bacterium]MDH5345363.1 regulatory signaling modulator protein AmpE [Gammaproteobacteria bacterium]
MKLLALLIGLIIERLATQLFHLRRLPWLDSAIDFGFRQASRFPSWPPLLPVLMLAIVLITPVLAIRFGLGDIWFDLPYLILAIIVLFFSLGPKDIGEDVQEYCRAIEKADKKEIAERAKALAETDVPDDAAERTRLVEESVCVQANNRLFAVVFWFVLLGPVGAWAYRVTDLIRRRAVFNGLREEPPGLPPVVEAAETLHGWLAFMPARLTAIGYAMAGSFDGALNAWRTEDEDAPSTMHGRSERLLARVGTGALALRDADGESEAERGIRGAIAANGLVYRLLFIWAAVIAAMTLYGWSV